MSSALWEEGVGEEGSPFPLRACPHVLLPAFHSHNQRARQTQGQLAACALSRDLWSVWIVIFCLDNSKLIVLLWPHKYQSSEPNILWLHFPFSITFYFSWSSSCSLSFFFHLFFVLWISDCLPTPSQKLFKTPFKFSTYSGLSDNLSVLFFSLTMLPGALCPAHMSPGPSPGSWHTSAILGVLSVFAADVPALFSLLDSLFVSWIPCLPLLIYPFLSQDFRGGSDGKVSARNAGDPGSIPGSGRSPGEGNGNPLQHPWLENPMVGRAW